VDDYIDCLSRVNLSPKDYILQLFENNDIVILGERDHRDTTQYDLILDIIGDKRFIEKVGHVYTEVGVINRTDFGNKVLKSEYKDECDFEEKILELYRELDFNPLWGKYNMYKYLKGIYHINRNLDEKNKITIGFTDCAFVWKGMTAGKYHAFLNRIYSGYTRDSIMAFNFIELYEKQIKKNGRKKALLIQSRPHAIKMDITINSVHIKTVGSYIFDRYGDKTKVVSFNYYKVEPEPVKLTDDGKWDAAFEMTGCKSAGFNIKDTPFGETKYDYAYGHILKYEDMMDGIIYYLPFYKFVGAMGIPDIVDDSFADELFERTIITESGFRAKAMRFLGRFVKKKQKKYYNNFRTFDCEDYKLLRAQMEKWLK
jgi:hypothetical protein